MFDFGINNSWARKFIAFETILIGLRPALNAWKSIPAFFNGRYKFLTNFTIVNAYMTNMNIKHLLKLLWCNHRDKINEIECVEQEDKVRLALK